MSNPFVGAIEAGGTKFVCAVGSGPDDLRAVERFPTTSPDETIGRALDYFRRQQREHGPLAAAGIGSFGPLDPNPRSPSYGRITSTPKPGWADTDLAGTVGAELGVPVGFDTDVNAAALAEGQWGAAQDVDNYIYLTIGTGIGGGAVVNGQLVHGLLHTEMGHIVLAHDWERDPYPGRCPYHGDCLEGMASGPAIGERWGVEAAALPVDHPAWALQADYLAQALRTFVLTLSPERIVLGGGVMHQTHLFPLVRAGLLESLNNYVQSPVILEQIERYVVPPGLGDSAGVLGALALAHRALA